ncbi:levansucrase [Clostridium acetobutylicum]|uniref:Levansucrase n=1 Tax=Clostridium acetobutylicum (strain ATCC 824 / DSM 792 / JCM 1419 / IAM 19013 / LMG 5710 / NBRC 13948 / NRRL B-527 / VKM B-1787 / 2291 / W) TaxID=272562 RepID=Q97I79_CLOAB|nr:MULTISPECIES: glycoside hydrolase family 68 protein [Clostridium]AAK79739.1 Levansucrase [Clostridium acetobutylicum ATCC 824]ADZ20823.1 Levansucrase [Clostridium acetobutylicum EA 2018]AEI34153.1 levansucrase [Clostridium acetobutylicum DSM 1731]AWV79826.1 glycoside hydrolase family 68 protein [Clostridium acetobutylicum]MBC2394192.1 glycoside hydrolase family 68 protein [Clostridium acetobutylicum]
MKTRKTYKMISSLMVILAILTIPFLILRHNTGYTSIWSRQQAQNFKCTKENTAPNINPNFKLTAPNLWVWDTWPLVKKDGSLAVVNGYKVIFALTASRNVGWNKRHDVAGISYFCSTDGENWVYKGLAYNVEDALGSRQWAGSAILDENGMVQFFYTATGRKGEAVRTFEQRLVKTKFSINVDKGGVHITNCSKHQVILEPDGVYYQTMQQAKGPIIYSFRDPYFFEDPKTKKDYLIFEGNKGGKIEKMKPENIGDKLFRKNHIAPRGVENFNGNVGIAVAQNKDLTRFKLLPPLLEAVGVNQQLERPQIVMKKNKYYLFTISHKFTYAQGLNGVDGLYGFCGNSLRSNYKPLNGNGLVITNPTNDPYQTYSWYLVSGHDVLSFINEYHFNGQLRYGGTFAPTLQISLKGYKSKIIGRLGEGVVTPAH